MAPAEDDDEIEFLFEQKSRQKSTRVIAHPLSPEIQVYPHRSSQKIRHSPTDIKAVNQIAISVAIKKLDLHLHTVLSSSESRSRIGSWWNSPTSACSSAELNSTTKSLILKLDSVKGLHFQGLVPHFLPHVIQPSQLIEVSVFQPIRYRRVDRRSQNERKKEVETFQLKIIYKLHDRQDAPRPGRQGNRRCKYEDSTQKFSHSKVARVVKDEDIIVISSDEDEGPRQSAGNAKTFSTVDNEDPKKDIKMDDYDLKPESDDERTESLPISESYEISCYLNLNPSTSHRDTPEGIKNENDPIILDTRPVNAKQEDGLSDSDDGQSDSGEFTKRFKNCGKLLMFLKKYERLIGLVHQNHKNFGKASGSALTSGSGHPSFDKENQTADGISEDDYHQASSAPALDNQSSGEDPNSLFPESTTPPLDELDSNLDNNQNIGPSSEPPQRVEAITIPPAQPTQPATTEGNPSLGTVSALILEQTEFQRALDEVDARRDFFSDNNPFHSDMNLSKGCLMDDPMVDNLDQTEPDVPPPAADLEVDPSSTTPSSSYRIYHVVSGSASAPSGDRFDGMAGGMPVDIPVTVGPVAAGIPGDIPVIAGPSADAPSRGGDGSSEEVDMDPSRKPSKTRATRRSMKDFESDQEDETDEPGKNYGGKVGREEEAGYSTEFHESTDDPSSYESDSRSASTIPPPQPNNSGGRPNPLSYEELKSQTTALENYMEQFQCKTQSIINGLKLKVKRLKQTTVKKSSTCRQLKARLQNKDDNMLELTQDIPQEYQTIQHQLEEALETGLNNQLRSIRTQISQKQNEIQILLKAREIHAEMRPDLQDQIQDLEVKIRQLEINPTNSMQCS